MSQKSPLRPSIHPPIGRPSTGRRAEPSGAPGLSKPAPSADPEPGLYLVATPIGNLADITLRARDLLKAADVIACEDTRVTRKLLQAHAIQTPMISYHEHNAERMRPKLIEQIKCGKAVALVSDAGTPLISDPGYKLVTDVIAAGLAVTTLPGPSAPLAALLLSGLPSDRFLYAGFLPPKAAARRQVLNGFATVPATLVFLESARRLAASLADMATVLGTRKAAVARELTKRFEEVSRGGLDDLAAHYQDTGAPKGEIVIVVAPPQDNQQVLSETALDLKLRSVMKTESLRDAAATVAAATGLPRRQVYARALELVAGDEATASEGFEGADDGDA